MKLKSRFSKYEWKFIRMMAKTFSTVVAGIIILTLMGISAVIRAVTFSVLLVISFIVKQFYWNYLEGMELQEKIDKVVVNEIQI